MESAASVRSQPAVSAFDPVDRLAEYGFKVADAEALAAARGLVDGLVNDVVNAIDAHFVIMRRANQNPYRDSLTAGGARFEFATLVDVLPANALSHSVMRVFSRPGVQQASPDVAKLADKLLRELRDKLAEHGFELAGWGRSEDRTPSWLVVRDPVYVAEATKARAANPIVADDFEAALERARSKPLPRMGLRSAPSPEVYDALQAICSELTERTAAAVAEHVRGAVEAGRSPFDSGHTSVHIGPRSVVVDESRVRHQLGNRARVYEPATVRVEAGDTPKVLLRGRVRKSVDVDAPELAAHLAQLIAERLRREPTLRAAVVAVEPAYRDMHINVVCAGAEPPAEIFSTSFWQNLWQGIVARFPALRPPTRTPALPPPAPIVPPVRIGPYASSDGAG